MALIYRLQVCEIPMDPTSNDCQSVDCSLYRESFFNSLINIPSVHDSEDPNFSFDDPKHYAIISNA